MSNLATQMAGLAHEMMVTEGLKAEGRELLDMANELLDALTAEQQRELMQANGRKGKRKGIGK